MPQLEQSRLPNFDEPAVTIVIRLRRNNSPDVACSHAARVVIADEHGAVYAEFTAQDLAQAAAAGLAAMGELPC